MAVLSRKPQGYPWGAARPPGGGFCQDRPRGAARSAPAPGWAGPPAIKPILSGKTSPVPSRTRSGSPCGRIRFPRAHDPVPVAGPAPAAKRKRRALESSPAQTKRECGEPHSLPMQRCAHLAATVRRHAVGDLVGARRRNRWWRVRWCRPCDWRRCWCWRCYDTRRRARSRWWRRRPVVHHYGLLHHGRVLDRWRRRLCSLSTAASQSMRRQRADGRARNQILHAGLRCLLDDDRRRLRGG